MKMEELYARLQGIHASQGMDAAVKLAIQFTHHADDGTQTDWAIAFLLIDPRYLAIEPVELEIRDHTEWLKTHGRVSGIEAHRLKALASVPTMDFTPITMLHWPDDSYLNVDGRHRYTMACLRRSPGIPARIVEHELWKDYVLEDAPKIEPDYLLAKFSNLPGGGYGSDS